MHDADISHYRFGENTSDLTGGERLLQSSNIIELDDGGGECRIDRRADVAAPGASHAILQGDETFVDGALGAIIKEEYFVRLGRSGSQSQREPIRIGGGEG